MAYYIAKFKRYVPSGVREIVSYDYYSIIETDDPNTLNDVSHEEITDYEATVAFKFYGEVRPYRSAYSDVEGLEPDPDELAKGKRKTKIYITPEIDAGRILLMKRIFKRNVLDVFSEREDQTGKEEILAMIDGLTTVKDICYKKEELLGIEMSKTQLLELGCWDEATNSRIGRMVFTLGF